MEKRKRTLKGLRADMGGITQSDVAKKAGVNYPTYNAIEQFVDDPTIAYSLGKLFGVKIEVSITDAE